MKFLNQSLVLLLVVFLTGYFASPLHETQTSAEVKDAIKEDFPDAEETPTNELSKNLTFIHGFNDTQKATTNFTAGGLINQIQNFGGYQKTVLNNKIQYNFYFWLVPKNFNATAWSIKNAKKQ